MSLLQFLLLSAFAANPPAVENGIQRAKELKEYITKEKKLFSEREVLRADLLSELDRLNMNQNKVRSRIFEIEQQQFEVKMALDNLSLEFQNQKELEEVQKKRMIALLKMVNHIKRSGIVRFLIVQEDLSAITKRIRTLYRTIRSHKQMTLELEARVKRLRESEDRLSETQRRMHRLVGELGDQEEILGDLLRRKHKMLSNLTGKQRYFKAAVKEYDRLSTHLASLFSKIESQRDTLVQSTLFPHRGTLPLPIETGRIIKNFGKSIHEKFGTVTYQKGMEIEADQNSPVSAVLSGVVEFEGWVKGLGNVMILHHGGGFYSLVAHLFKILKPKGTQVKQGETLGLVGDTGNNERPSVYFELREKGKAVDPILYFSKEALLALR